MTHRSVLVFFFKQKTAYEIMPSLVGSAQELLERDDLARAVFLGRDGG